MRNEWLDEDNYPTEKTLKRIRHWNLTIQGTKELVDFIEEVWTFGDWGFRFKNGKLELHTGGWSGNEDIIRALQKTDFWWLFWEKSVVGGHYYFKVREIEK